MSKVTHRAEVQIGNNRVEEYLRSGHCFGLMLGGFEMADHVYELRGQFVPEPGRLIDSKLGYCIRPGKHSMNREDWRVFLDFADKHLQSQR